MAGVKGRRFATQVGDREEKYQQFPKSVEVPYPRTKISANGEENKKTRRGEEEKRARPGREEGGKRWEIRAGLKFASSTTKTTTLRKVEHIRVRRKRNEAVERREGASGQNIGLWENKLRRDETRRRRRPRRGGARSGMTTGLPLVQARQGKGTGDNVSYRGNYLLNRADLFL